jgi:hypothetical protein
VVISASHLNQTTAESKQSTRLYSLLLTEAKLDSSNNAPEHPTEQSESKQLVSGEGS